MFIWREHTLYINLHNYKIGICCFSVTHAPLKRKKKDCLAQNQDDVSDWSYMSISGLLFQ